MKLKNEFAAKVEKKHEAYIKKYHVELAQYDYDPEALHTAWGMDWISKYKYKSLLQLLENEPNRLLPEDYALNSIENLLLSCEKDKCIAKNDEEGHMELLRQESKRRRIDWSKHAEIYLKGLSLVSKKLLKINDNLKQIAAKKHQQVLKAEYAALELYEFDVNQIHNAYGYEIIDLDEHDRLIKLLEQSENTAALPEEEAVNYFTRILKDCEYEKQIVEVKDKPLKIR